MRPGRLPADHARHAARYWDYRVCRGTTRSGGHDDEAGRPAGSAAHPGSGDRGGRRLARNLPLDGLAADEQFTTGGALPRGEKTADRLRVTIDGRTATVPLRRTCTDAELAQDYADRRVPCADDPMGFDLSNGYSALLNIS